MTTLGLLGPVSLHVSFGFDCSAAIEISVLTSADANHMSTPNPTTPGSLPVLYADEYGKAR